MEDFTKVAHINDIPAGKTKTVTAGGRRIAIAHVDGEFFAIDDTCSHEECSLGTEGFLDGSILICGCHGSTFDVTSGKVLSLPAPTDVASYEVKIKDGDVWIKF